MNYLMIYIRLFKVLTVNPRQLCVVYSVNEASGECSPAQELRYSFSNQALTEKMVIMLLGCGRMYRMTTIWSRSAYDGTSL